MLSVDEAAERLGVKKGTIWGMFDRGELPKVMVGRHCRIPVEAVEAFRRGEPAYYGSTTVGVAPERTADDRPRRLSSVK